MAPVKVGIIGLGATGPALGPGAWAVAAHLASFVPSPHYEIVAVCNSSVESAQRSIDFHKLPSTVKAYGNPEDIANDPNVDLVVVSIIVTNHHKVAKPAVLAKKQVFVEWPLGANTGEAEELTKLAKEANLKTIVGSQFRLDPALIKFKELIDSGAIGKVTSTQAQYSPFFGPPGTWMADAAYYLDFKSGGNEFHIAFGHFFDSFLYVLGDFATVKATFSQQYPIMKLVNTKTGEIVDPAFPKTAPDHMFVQGVLDSGAIASVNYNRPGELVGKTLRWTISGTEGEIELTLNGALQMGHSEREIRIKTGEDKEARVVDWQVSTPAHVEGVQFPGQNTARLFEAYAHNDKSVPDFEDGLRLHRLLDRIAKDAGYV
ncbi:Galactose/lactose metabolism regulatory protein GAL80 [Trichoderma lentiforme]|uniref:Galactose/lactose metabolism regulatory protein GAL80 n=1 Tax=Trichoderma lentiforme TaxID=1567552 RepID=A0A9P4XM06_9HYPO|nr:Galactose/lactose metabolism regulatory protein GAL80 [Trichoderma lentiforme]